MLISNISNFMIISRDRDIYCINRKVAKVVSNSHSHVCNSHFLFAIRDNGQNRANLYN